jgi:hypothetical protein
VTPGTETADKAEDQTEDETEDEDEIETQSMVRAMAVDDDEEQNSTGGSATVQTPTGPIYVTVQSEDGERTAVFVLTTETGATSGTVTLNETSYYTPTGRILATAGVTDAALTGFPAGTRCTVAGKTYLLYCDDLSMTIPAGKTAVFDLSQTDAPDTLILSNEGGEQHFELACLTLPTFPEDTPVVLGEGALYLSLPYSWGDSNLTVTLTREQGGTWVAADSGAFTCTANGTPAQVLFRADGAVAGSYRATLTWTDNGTGITLLTYSFPFCVFYPERAADATPYEYVDGVLISLNS